MRRGEESTVRARGPLRLGVAEEFTRALMMQVLVAFTHRIPDDEVSVTCDANHRLLHDADRGRFEAVPSKAPIARLRSDVIRRLPPAWVGRPDTVLPVTDPVPLALPQPPDPFRELTLWEAGHAWRVQFETIHPTALEAAAKAGFGIAVVGKPVPLLDVVQLDLRTGLPTLPDDSLVFLCKAADPADEGVQAMRAIIESIYHDVPDSDYRPA